MKKDKTDNDVKLLTEVRDLFVTDTHTLAEQDDDGDLKLKVFFSPEVTASSYIACADYGYVIVIDFDFGTRKHKYVLTKKANEINENLREGAFFVSSEDCHLRWKNHIPYMEGLKALDVARSFKIGISSFLTMIGDFVEAMEKDTGDTDVIIIEPTGESV